MFRRPQRQSSWAHQLLFHRRGTLVPSEMWKNSVKVAKPHIQTVFQLRYKGKSIRKESKSWFCQNESLEISHTLSG